MVIAVLGLMVVSSPAAAHGELVASSPKPGETVGTAVHIDLVFSTTMTDWTLTVEGPDGEPVEGSAVQKASSFLSYEAVPLSAAGQYIVRYSGIDSDNDVLEGAYAFVVEDGAPPPAELPDDLVIFQSTGWAWWVYALLLLGVLVVAVLAGLLAEKVRRLRTIPPAA